MDVLDIAVEAHLPGRTMPDHGILLIPRDRVFAHAGKIVVRMVVFAHVFQTEAPVFPLAHPTLRRAMRRLAGAARPLADWRVGDRLARLGLDPNAVEQRRVEFHDRPLCGNGARRRKLDKAKCRASGIRFRG